MDSFPSLPQYDDATTEALLAGRTPSFGEAMGANVQEGWWGSAFGQIAAAGREIAGERADPSPLTREAYQAEFARPGMAWDERMTRGRAAAMARTFDENQSRRQMLERRDAGLGEQVIGFGAQMLGSAISPETFIPFAGPTGTALRAVGAGRAAERLLAPGITAGIGRGAVEGVLGNAAVAPGVYAGQARYGEDVSWGRLVGDLAAGAILGGAFGGVGGALGRYADRRQAAALLDVAAADVAAGRPLDVPAAAIAQVAEDAAVRSAPAEALGMVRADAAPGARLDLPVGPEGLPISRAEFAVLIERDRLTRPVELADLDARDAAEAQAAPGARPVLELLEQMRRGEAQPRGEKSLAQFVVEQGGIREERGDVRNMMGAGTRTRPGLLNNARGLPVDEMAELARAAGYFPEFGERWTSDAVGADGFGMRAFLEALDEDLNKTRQRFGDTEDVNGRQMREALGDLDALLERNGASINDPPERILEVLRGLREDAPGRSLDDLVREDAAYGWYRDALAAQQRAAALTTALPEDARGPAVLPEVKPEAEAAGFAHEIDALRDAGRLTAEDVALLRAGDEAASEGEALARGIEEAAACTLRNAA